jgi:hypothetical protein
MKEYYMELRGEKYPTCSKNKQGSLDWSYLAGEPPSETSYRAKYRGKNGNEGKARAKT